MSANVSQDAKGWRVDVRLPDGRKTSIRLGKNSNKRHHDEVAAKVRALVAARTAGGVPDPEVSRWLPRCPDRLYARLVDLGLVDARERDRPFVDWFDAYFEKHGAAVGATAGTRRVWNRARKYASQFFGARRLSSLRETDAADFRTMLLARPGKNSATMAEATVRKLCGVLGQACKAAVKAGVLASNPFSEVPTAAGANEARECYVELTTVRRVMDAAGSDELRLLIGLSRFAGLRVPSEIRGLRWGDVDWEGAALRVSSPKTAKQGKPWRRVPIVEALMPTLEAAYHAAPEGAEFILPTLRLHANPSMPLLRAVRAAGVDPWPRIFHAMRASCVTDLAALWPLADVASWMGHTRVVAARHYLRPTEGSFAAATGRAPAGGGARGGNLAANVVAPVVAQTSARSGNTPQRARQVPGNKEVTASPCGNLRDTSEPCASASNASSEPYWT